MHLERTADATLPPPFCIYVMYFGQDGCQVPNGHFPEPTYIKVDGYDDYLKKTLSKLVRGFGRVEERNLAHGNKPTYGRIDGHDRIDYLRF